MENHRPRPRLYTETLRLLSAQNSSATLYVLQGHKVFIAQNISLMLEYMYCISSRASFIRHLELLCSMKFRVAAADWGICEVESCRDKVLLRIELEEGYSLEQMRPGGCRRGWLSSSTCRCCYSRRDINLKRLPQVTDPQIINPCMKLFACSYKWK